jgi:two-component system, chemotaxis family, chemotaxis protein CheY
MGATILVVDDSPMIRRQVGRTLSDQGYVVIDAADGLDAIQKLATNPETRLIVCDVDMPRMNGIEFVEWMNGGGSRIPVVLLTNENRPELIQRAKALGAKGWIAKPFRPDLLISVVRKLLG